MILEIYSSYGRLEATPMTLQAIETSILPEHESEKQLSQFAVDAAPVDSDCCEEHLVNPDDLETQE